MYNQDLRVKVLLFFLQGEGFPARLTLHAAARSPDGSADTEHPHYSGVERRQSRVFTVLWILLRHRLSVRLADHVIYPDITTLEVSLRSVRSSIGNLQCELARGGTDLLYFFFFFKAVTQI